MQGIASPLPLLKRAGNLAKGTNMTYGLSMQ